MLTSAWNATLSTFSLMASCDILFLEKEKKNLEKKPTSSATTGQWRNGWPAAHAHVAPVKHVAAKPHVVLERP